MKKERWLPVVGFEGSYEVSDQGRVRSLDRFDNLGRPVRGRVLVHRVLTNTSGNKYSRVSLSQNGTTTDAYVSALVLEAFVGPRLPKYEAAHIDGNPQNNSLDNLAWKSAQGNADDRVRHGTTTRGERNPQSTLTESKVRAIRKSIAGGASTPVVAMLYGIHPHHVARIVRREQWKHI